MLTVGDKLPAFNVKSVVSLEKGKEFKDITQDSFKGKWQILFFWPKDFTFICPTEIAEFGKHDKDFKDRDAQILGVSTDSEFVHHAWRTHHADLKHLPFPMLADIKRELSASLGVLHKEEGVALRATFIVDPEGIIRHVSVNDLSVGRNVKEVLRTLDAFQTDELCPCNWQKGEETLTSKLQKAG
ncbi:peroxiredoxin [Melittangium boletus]|uniref:Alkyl hydroperoxide reductase C n=1 Tax=Melittangium boletus DSM 14713 TaxID=1294270 RepID=A0A250IKF3_9BACT|nr:peroxiredoxin [Melittangium boletus]ATB31671.1 alkyl hydroperoxide reductase [Melittangium boletus DSM 14713]